MRKKRLIEQLGGLEISPIIDIRNCWQGEETRQFKDTDIVYSYDGKVYYVGDSGEKIELGYLGYDKGSKSFRYCPWQKEKLKKTRKNI